MTAASPLSGARVDQVLPNLSPGDAASDAGLAFGGVLARAGADTALWSSEIHPERAGRARRFDPRGMRRRAPDLVLLHYTTGSAVPGALRRTGLPYGLYFHNVTPPRYFLGANDLLAGFAWRGLAELPTLLREARLVLSPSCFSAAQLRAAGARDVGLVPIPLDPAAHAAEPDPAWLSRFGDGRPNVLCVGRIAPNKRQDELVRAFYYYSRGAGRGRDARLLLVGAPAAAPLFQSWLERAIGTWELEGVHLTGHVSDAARAACYRVGTVYVSLSEHEGFGVPLVEAMHHGVPVIARAAAAVGETLGDAGLLVRDADPRRVAELIGMVVENGRLRAAMVEAGRRRAAEFAPERVAGRLVAAVAAALGRPAGATAEVTP
ncbi:MAG TPA: glycosyltransferase [Chloroflexota bacterium]|jgi:glycosyltransferase involved in cell wall biosynthesis|nr:glycosyltransferase [Chloroflexota bacterium]